MRALVRLQEPTRKIFDRLELTDFLSRGASPNARQARANASGTSRGRIAWWPAARLCQAKETRQRFVEQRRLLKIQNVARLRKHRQPRGRDGLFEEQARLDTRVIFIANDDQSRQRQVPDAILEGVDRRPPALKATLGMSRPLRVVTCQRFHEFEKSARVLDLEGNPVRRITIGLGDLGGSERFEVAGIVLRAFAEASIWAGSEPEPTPASVSDSTRCGRCSPT